MSQIERILVLVRQAANEFGVKGHNFNINYSSGFVDIVDAKTNKIIATVLYDGRILKA